MYERANKVAVALTFLLFCQFSLINQIVAVFRASPFYHGTYSDISPSVLGSTHQRPVPYMLTTIIYNPEMTHILAPGHSQTGGLLPSGTHYCQWNC